MDLTTLADNRRFDNHIALCALKFDGRILRKLLEIAQPEATAAPPPPSKAPGRKLKTDQRHQLPALIHRGYSLTAAARKLGVTYATAQRYMAARPQTQ